MKPQDETLEEFFGTDEPVEPTTPIEDPETPTGSGEPPVIDEPSAEPPVEDDLEDILGGGKSEETPSIDEPAAEPLVDEDEEEEEEVTLSLTDDEFDKIATDKDSFAGYVSKAIEFGKKQAVESLREEFEQKLDQAKQDMLRQIPDVVGRTAERQMAVQGVIKNFYDSYPTLNEHKDYVRDMTRSVQAANSDWTAQQILDEVGKRAERDLRISKEAEKRERQRQPTFAGAGGRRSPSGSTDTRTKTQKQLDDFFEFSQEQKR